MNARTQSLRVNVYAVEHHHTSCNGNPSYTIKATLVGTDGTESNPWVFFEGVTGSDYACGYGATNYRGKECIVHYHYTKRGNCIIERFEGIKD